MPRQVDLVNFDFGNVLVRFDTQRWYDFVRANQPPGAANPESFFLSDICAAYDLDQIDDLEFFRQAQKALSLNVGKDQFFFNFCDLMKPDPKMLRLRNVIHQNGVKTAVISNINRFHFEYARRIWPEVFMSFDYLALSFLLKVRKPDHKIFDASAQYLGVSPERCVLVDDLKVNTDSFEKWGGISCRYNVVDDKFRPNGQVEIERNKLTFKMASLGVLTYRQAINLTGVDF